MNKVQWKILKLMDVAYYSRDRVSALTLNHNNYVGVDNLLPEKKGKTVSSYVPVNGNLIRYNTGDILIGNIRPYLKKIWQADNDGGTNGDVLVIRINPNVETKITSDFLYYVLSSNSFFEYNTLHSKGAKMPRGDKSAIMKYSIAVPPLVIQREIVTILDKFTQLEAELETELKAELEARHHQYEYYKNKLLFSNDLLDFGGGGVI